MRWPLVSRRAFDVLLDERDRLRVVNDELTSHLVRMHRVEHGVAETPRKLKPPPEAMPRSLVEYFNGLENRSMAKHLCDQAKKNHVKGEPWSSIQGKILEKVSADT